MLTHFLLHHKYSVKYCKSQKDLGRDTEEEQLTKSKGHRKTVWVESVYRKSLNQVNLTPQVNFQSLFQIQMVCTYNTEEYLITYSRQDKKLESSTLWGIQSHPLSPPSIPLSPHPHPRPRSLA